METTFPATCPNDVFQVRTSCLQDHEGSIMGNVISLNDITQEKSVEKAKHTFIAHVAHELRAPLTTIKSYNEMLMEGDVDDPETKKEFSNTINEEADRLANLIENLLNISKMELGGMTVEKGLVKTSWLYKDCLAAVSGPAKKKHITIRKKPPDKWPSLLGDKELLKVALINILGNAVKYTPENKSIGFAMEEHDDFVVFDVADQGYGVAKLDLPKIFEPFYRAEDANIQEQTGSGLGLAMTADIIRLHGGEIKVKSIQGKGTHFRIQLPKGNHQLADQ
jgi:two-component system sensor histidine kinase VicK